MCRGRLLNQYDDYFIIANWKEMSNTELAKRLGVAKETISRRGAKLGLIHKRKISPEDHEKIIAEIASYKLGIETVGETEARKKTLELSKIRNMFNVNDNLKLRIKTKIINGQIIQKTNDLIALKLENHVECFKYIDFYTNKAVII